MAIEKSLKEGQQMPLSKVLRVIEVVKEGKDILNEDRNKRKKVKKKFPQYQELKEIQQKRKEMIINRATKEGKTPQEISKIQEQIDAEQKKILKEQEKRQRAWYWLQSWDQGRKSMCWRQKMESFLQELIEIKGKVKSKMDEEEGLRENGFEPENKEERADNFWNMAQECYVHAEEIYKQVRGVHTLEVKAKEVIRFIGIARYIVCCCDLEE
jgi:hypothetical protein